MPRIKNQHYISQAKLRLFASEREQIGVYDKKNLAFRFTSVRKIACERYFYDILDESEESGSGPWREISTTQEGEMFFGRIDHEEAQLSRLIFERLKDGIGFDREIKVKLAYLLTVQLFRTRKFRDQLTEALNRFAQWLDGDQSNPIPPRGGRGAYLQMNVLLGALERDLPLSLYDFTLLIATNPTSVPFVLSDAPVVLHPAIEDGVLLGDGPTFAANLVAMPLSPTVAAVFIRKGTDVSIDVADSTSVPFTEELVRALNSLQYQGGRQHIFVPCG